MQSVNQITMSSVESSRYDRPYHIVTRVHMHSPAVACKRNLH